MKYKFKYFVISIIVDDSLSSLAGIFRFSVVVWWRWWARTWSGRGVLVLMTERLWNEAEKWHSRLVFYGFRFWWTFRSLIFCFVLIWHHRDWFIVPSEFAFDNGNWRNLLNFDVRFVKLGSGNFYVEAVMIVGDGENEMLKLVQNLIFNQSHIVLNENHLSCE